MQQNENVQGSGPVNSAMAMTTNRTCLKAVLLSIITLGIYGIVVNSIISTDINTLASRHDNKKTMHFCLLFFLVGPLTLGIGAFVWWHRISNRIGNELQLRGIDYSIGAKDFWLWNILGALILVGPFVYTHKYLKAMNLLGEDYNQKGI